MKHRSLGSTGIQISEVGFGAWQLGNSADWSAMEDAEAIALVHAALDQGCNFFDTAPNYGRGKSELILGAALEGRRHQAVISSKFGHHADGGHGFPLERLRPTVEESLRKLRTDYLDCLLLHNPTVEAMAAGSPLWDELEALKQEGKIRSYGASVDWSEDMFRVMRHSRSQVMEILFNVFHQEPILAFEEAKQKGVGLIAKVPLDSGWLSGKYGAESRFQGVRARWKPEIIQRRATLVDRVREITGEGSAPSLTQAALRFILAFDAMSTVIPGVRTLEQLRENLSASQSVMPEPTVNALRALWQESLKDRPLPW